MAAPLCWLESGLAVRWSQNINAEIAERQDLTEQSRTRSAVGTALSARHFTTAAKAAVPNGDDSPIGKIFSARS
jgi:hypothetical protein